MQFEPQWFWLLSPLSERSPWNLHELPLIIQLTLKHLSYTEGSPSGGLNPFVVSTSFLTIYRQGSQSQSYWGSQWPPSFFMRVEHVNYTLWFSERNIKQQDNMYFRLTDKQHCCMLLGRFRVRRKWLLHFILEVYWHVQMADHKRERQREREITETNGNTDQGTFFCSNWN